MCLPVKAIVKHLAERCVRVFKSKDTTAARDDVGVPDTEEDRLLRLKIQQQTRRNTLRNTITLQLPDSLHDRSRRGLTVVITDEVFIREIPRRR